MILGFSIYEIINLFFIYGFLGWCVEVAYCGLECGTFVNRGFLNGPICPIYGVGGVIVVLCLTPICDNIILLFLGSALLTTILELITGFALDKIFHARWWDYSEVPFNLNGYVCLKFSVYWGLVCIALMRGIHPVIFGFVEHIPHFLGVIALVFLAVVFITDAVITVLTINKLTKRMKLMNEIAEKIHSVSDDIGEHVYEGAVHIAHKGEEIRSKHKEELEELKEKYTAMVNERHLLQRRIIKAFPNIRLHKHNEHLDKLKERISKK
ncbi:MAG: putative ABC transporter permease [Oscillospiraceae bacterium]|nr:putative ABC transporter permease [Oscillospiraceae bacterium]